MTRDPKVVKVVCPCGREFTILVERDYAVEVLKGPQPLFIGQREPKQGSLFQ